MIPRSIIISPFLTFLLVVGAPALFAGGGKTSHSTTAAQMDLYSYVGEEMCAGCHSDMAEQFGYSMHGRLQDWEVRGEFSRCEMCHGAGSKHVEESGDAQYIFNFSGQEGMEASKACVSCHYSGKAGMWPGSVHMMGGLGCGDCHTIHQSRQVVTPASNPLVGVARNPEVAGLKPLKQGPPIMASLTKREPEVCLDCHQEKRAQINYNSHHPIVERRMKCSSCHDVHGSEEEFLLATRDGQRELCTSCHAQYSGPFVFEHAAVEEGCNTCHNPHGTTANNLLKQNEPFVCLQCHEAHFHIGRDGIDTPIDRATGSVTNKWGSSGWRQAFATKCSNCHQMVHGSDLPSQSLGGRGGSLTR